MLCALQGAIDKLKAHERTKAYFKDKGFCKKIEEITQEDREQGKLKLKDHMFDSHIMQCIGILTDIMMPNTSVRHYDAKHIGNVTS